MRGKTKSKHPNRGKRFFFLLQLIPCGVTTFDLHFYLAHVFTPDALPDTSLPSLPGLGLALKCAQLLGLRRGKR